MGFIQIVEYRTSRPNEVRELSEKFQSRLAVSGVGGGPSRVTITEDRDERGIYRSIVEFDSYDSAMANSDRPETAEWAAALGELIDGAPKFYNLDVVETITP